MQQVLFKYKNKDCPLIGLHFKSSPCSVLTKYERNYTWRSCDSIDRNFISVPVKSMPCSSQFQLFINAKYRTFLLSDPVLVIQRTFNRNKPEYKKFTKKTISKDRKITRNMSHKCIYWVFFPSVLSSFPSFNKRIRYEDVFFIIMMINFILIVCISCVYHCYALYLYGNFI